MHLARCPRGSPADTCRQGHLPPFYLFIHTLQCTVADCPTLAVRTSRRCAAPQVDTSRRTLRYSLAEVAALLVTTFLQVS
jgi:hypothetical protein